ncbi:MAG: fused MFS/spermidine synthase [Bacteroidota bacterium]|nr:fused MFS/spermidine synthase [Bacteroidota bacterium]
MRDQKVNVYSDFKLLLLSGFISGGAVMSAELVSAKLISSFYGNSLYVWSAVLAITLGGLASGYFLGGYLSTNKKRSTILTTVFFLVALLMFFMPALSSFTMEWTLGISLKAGIVISSLIFVFPPLCCFGMVSPLIIGSMEQKINEPGKVSGIVYSISTIGGIIFTFLTGYYLIPYWGLKETSYLMGILLGLSVVFTFFSKTKQSNI